MGRPNTRPRTFREWRKKQAYRILPVFVPLVRFLIRSLGATMRVRLEREGPVMRMVEEGKPVLVAFFHGRQFVLVHEMRHRPVVIMTSISYLGEIQARVLGGFGFRIVRGSSSRGGVKVLGEMIRHLRRGYSGAFAVDGPRGPGGVVKPGIIFIARKLGVPIIPVTTSARPSILLRSAWDRYLLPMPFSRGLVLFGTPWHPEGNEDDPAVREDCLKLAQILSDLEKEADALVGKTKR
jgi:lysophospholipid acyltransferase (LPLAT)-like uncharacterized protein